MQLSKINDFDISALENIFIFSMNVSLALAVMFLQLFVCESVNAATGRFDFNGKQNTGSGYRNVRVGLYENKPKIFTDEAGVASGIFPVILEDIAKRERWQLTYVPCKWSECLEALEQGRIDLMPDVAFSVSRDKRFDFHSEEVVSSWSVIYVRNIKQISKIGDLNGRRLAVLKGSIQQTILQQLFNGFGFNVTLIESKSFKEAFSLASQGAVDAVVSNHFFGDYFHQQYGLKKTSIVFNPVSLYFATASGANSDLLKAIDTDLRKMKSEPGSIYYQALVAWLEKPKSVVVPPYIIWIISAISGLLVLAFVFILLLRWQIKVGTRHLAHANELLRDSEKKFRDIFHQHTAVKLLIDIDTGRIIEANIAAEKFYGWSLEQLQRMRIHDICVMSTEEVEAAMEKAGNLDGIQTESRHLLADGSIRDVVVFSSRIDIQGKPCAHYIIHDITKHYLLEEQLRQAQKMESVGRLAGGVAHDYNNMLGVILGYSDLALQSIDKSDPLYADLLEISNAAKRSISITRQLLAFARKQIVEPIVLDLNEVVGGMLKMLRRLIGEDIDLAWLPSEDIAPIRIDPSQVDQIMANLCVNARDAIVDVGKVTIETENVIFDEEYCVDHAGFIPGKFVMLAVSDDGCGMDKETLDHVFEPFFTTKKVGEGTGLGLSTVYGIVKQNNGFINIYSEPGKGTSFKIYFSRHDGKINKVSAINPKDISLGQGEMVLLVEDEQSILQLGKKMLERLGFQVLHAISPSEAIKLAEEYAGSIDLLITDVVMPEMNGRDLADRLHTLYPDLKIMFMSGYTADSIAHRGVLDEGVNFIHKPFSQQELAIKVGKALNL